MKEIILVDPYTSGHHLSYVRIYASIFLELGCRVSVLCNDVQALQETLSELMSQHNGRLRILSIFRRDFSKIEFYNRKRVGVFRDLVESYSACQNFMEVSKSIRRNRLGKDSLVFMMWLDSYISKYLFSGLLRLIFPYRWAGLYFHSSHIKQINERGRRYRDLLHFIPIFTSRDLKFVGLFDEIIVEKLRRRYHRDAFSALPDIAETHTPCFDSKLVLDILRHARGRKIVALLGSLDTRKNVVGFFELASSCDNDDIFYICVGNLAKQLFSMKDLDFVFSAAEEHKDKIFFHNKHVDSDSTFDALFSISIAIVAVYKNFTSSSNMITKSAIHGKYIIVSDEFLMAETVKRYDMGVCVEYGDLEGLRQAVLTIVANHDGMNGKFDEYITDHSYTKLKEKLMSLTDVDK